MTLVETALKRENQTEVRRFIT